jgi:hypothetical protein
VQRDERISRQIRELAEQMIRDGRLPTPAKALERRDAERQAAHDKPANVRARQKAKEKRDHSAELSMRSWRAKFRDDEETPLWECIADAREFGHVCTSLAC